MRRWNALDRLRGLGGSTATVMLLAASAAHAVDGTIEINQASALAGGISSSDTAGFPVTLDSPGSYRLTSNLIVQD